MKLFEEGKEVIRGVLDGNDIWILIGSVLYKANKKGSLNKVTTIPDDFCSGRHWGFNMRIGGASILLFSSVNQNVWKIDKNELSYKTFNSNFEEEEKDYFVQPLGEGRNLLISVKEGNAIIFDNTGKFEDFTECTREIKKELENRHLHFRNIRYYGTQIEGNELLTGVRTEERDIFVFLDNHSLRINRIVEPKSASEKISDFLLDGDYLWLRSKSGVNQIAKYDIRENRVCKSIDLPEEFGRRVLIRKVNKEIFLISVKGCIGIIDEEMNEARILKSGNYTPLDIDIDESIRILCRDEKQVHLFEYNDRDFDEAVNIPLKTDLSVFLDMII